MKTPRVFHKPNKWKKLALLGAVAMVLASCGKDTENQVVADSPSPTTTPTVPTGSGTSPVIIGVGSGAYDYWEQMKAQHSCPNGSARMYNDMTFSLQGGAYQAQISGNLQPNEVPGTISQTYTGMNLGTKDLIFIAQVNNGSQVAYNVVVSLCSWQGYTGREYIGNNTPLSNFRLDYMTLSSSTNCPTGKILDGWLTFTSQTYAQDNYGNGNIPTRFAPISSSCY